MSTCKTLARMALRSALAVACLAPLAQIPARAADKVIFAWPGPGSSGMAPLAFAEDLGYAKAENLDIDIVSLSGAGVVIPQLLNGSIFTSYITLDPLIISRDPGKPNFDFRFVYNAVRNSAWEIAVLDKSPIHTIKDLAGKTIGVGALTFGNVPMTKAILNREAGPNNGADFVAVGVGAPAFQALRSGKVDAINLWDVQDARLEQEGTKIRRIAFPPEFTGVSSHSLPVTNKMIRERPDLVAKFGRVFAIGTVACVANPTGCLKAYWAHFPSTQPSPNFDDAVKFEMPQLQARLVNMVAWNAGEPRKFGAFSDRDFTAAIQSLRAGGLIGDGQIKLDTLYTNQFVDDYNRFDQAEVVAKAKAFK